MEKLLDEQAGPMFYDAACETLRSEPSHSFPLYFKRIFAELSGWFFFLNGSFRMVDGSELARLVSSLCKIDLRERKVNKYLEKIMYVLPSFIWLCTCSEFK